MEKTRYDLNKELAQMLKGGVIMDVTTPEQPKLHRKQAPALLWLWNVFLRIFELPAVYRG